MKAQGFILVLASVALGAMSMAGCSSDPKDTGAGGAGGDSTTNTNTSSTSTNGGDGGNGGGSSSTSPTTVGSSSSTGGNTKDASELVGAQCGKDSDCGTGGTCYKSTDLDSPFGAAIQNGYCSKSCETNDECGATAECAQLTDDAAGPKACIATCTMNTDYLNPAKYTLDPAKCQGRYDLGCYQAYNDDNTEAGSPLCRPACETDGCDGNLVCDPASGFCVSPEDGPTGTTPYGRACDPTKADDPCAGFCISMGGDAPKTAGFCTGVCVLGDTTDQYGHQCGGLGSGFCAYGLYDYPEDDFKGVQDLGICAGACKSQDDCAAPYTWCNDIGWTDNGFCFGTADCTQDSDCKGYDDPTEPVLCTDTASGKKCLDYVKVGTDAPKLKYPLGAQTPGTDPTGSGGGGAGGSGGGGAGGSGGGAD